MRAQCARLGRFLRRRPSERRLNWCATWPAREKSAPTVDRLLPLMRSGSPLLRWECVWALGEIGDHRAVEPLIEALEDTDSSVSEGAALALSKLGSLAVDRLIEALPSADPEVRLAVVWVLGVVRDQRAASYLAPLLGSADAAMRATAATALGRLRAPSAVPLLVDLLRDQDEEVRGAAANALGLVADARAIGPLLELERFSQVSSCVCRSLVLGLQVVWLPWVRSMAHRRAWSSRWM
ncbi:MAG: HEAT repeat domain-containing protein, partial [candidate division WS1 bacterium]|nr:HEAT repeat domain-containing protein [candidate division WS1 bacterium]